MVPGAAERERSRRAGPRAVAAALLLLPGLLGAAAAAPRRVVSLNLCADQLLVLLAERERIASLSFLAADPVVSAMAAAATGLPVNHGLVEEVLPLEPDLVLAGAYTARSAVALLRRLGYRVVVLAPATTLDGIRANLRTVAAALDERERGEALLAAFEQALGPPPRAAPGEAPVAALYVANGYSPGRGTPADALVRRAGLRNLAAERGLTGLAPLPVETLLMARPDLLVIGRSYRGPALADAPLRHPALAKAFAGRATVHIPDRLWSCGTPLVAEAVRRLRAARARVRQGR